MSNIPDKCFKCGAPIKWDKSSNYIDCEYCGYSNLINLGSLLFYDYHIYKNLG